MTLPVVERLYAHRRGLPAEAVRPLFVLMDQDQDQRLSRLEFQHFVVPALSLHVRKQAAERFVAEADRDHNKQISPEELLNGESAFD